MKKIFNYNMFEENLNIAIKEGKELTENELEAHYILNTISDYCDCTPEFAMTVTEEGINTAIKMLENNMATLAGIVAANQTYCILENKILNRKASTKDLF